MSYILDALKKSEESRVGSLQKSITLPANTPSPRPSSYLWFFVVIVTGVLIGGWLLIQKQQTDTEANKSLAQHLQSSQLGNQAPKPVMPVARPAAPHTVVSQTTAPHAVTAKPLTPKSIAPKPMSESMTSLQPTPPKPIQQSTKPLPSAKVQPPSVVTLQANQTSKKVTSAADNSNIPKRSELPINVQQSLPDIQIEGHIYDMSPAARMVVINGRIRREGQSLGAGLTLEKITAHGIILSHQGMRFRIPVFGQ